MLQGGFKAKALAAILCVAGLLPGLAWSGAASGMDKATPECIDVSAVGDVMMGSVFPAPILPPDDGATLFDPVKPFLRGDIIFCNLEGPLIDGGQSRKCIRNGIPRENCFAFAMPERYARHLSSAGFTVVNIANNHVYDFGEHGLSSTLGALAREGIEAAGCGRIARFQIRGRGIAVIGLTFSPLPSRWGSVLDIRGAKKIIRLEKSRKQLVIVSFHAGAEGKDAAHVTGQEEIFAREQRGNVRDFAREAVNAGADLVIGHGPHVLRAVEIYRNKLIVYSLGNFLTYGRFNLKGPNGLGAVLQARIDSATGDFIRGRIVPVALQQGGIPAFDPTLAAVSLIKALTLEDMGSSAAGITDKGEIYPVDGR